MNGGRKQDSSSEKGFNEGFQKAVTEVESFLKDTSDLSLTVGTDSLPKGKIGEYERGSVFEKNVTVTVDVNQIRHLLPYWEDALKESVITLWHEVGHAIVEQVIDWTENIPEAEEFASGPTGERFFNVFNDDFLTEEELVEDFALAAISGMRSELDGCWKEMNKYLENI